MKKFLSFVLAFVMVVTTFVGVIPPLEASAATAASISSLKASPKEAYEGDSVQVTGTVKSGSYYLRAIQINVRNEGDDDHGFTVDRVDFNFSKKKTSYSLSNLDEIEIGSYTCSGCGRKESLDVGEHRIDIHVGLYDSNGDEAEGFTKSIWIEVLEEEPPYVKDIDADVDGTEVEFTVKTNLTAKYGIVLYADGYKLDMIDWDKDTYSSYIKYTGSHVFNQVGERTITVYALDEDGDIVDDSDDSITVEIDSLGRVDPPTITTKDNQSIEVGNSFKVSWTKPSSPSGVTFKYNVYVWDGKTNTLVGENLTTTSCTIPAGNLSKADTYAISVIAMAKDYTQSDDDLATINLTVNEVQENPQLTDIDIDVDGTTVEITLKGNLDAKYGVVIYFDGYKLDMIDWDKDAYSSYIKYTGSHVLNQVGSRNVEAYPLDKDGNEVRDGKVSTTITLVSLGVIAAPSITTANNQKIEVGNSFKITWTKPATPSGVTFKYNVYVWDGTNNTLVAENLTTTSYTIPANKLSKVGTYAISVIAMATDYTQSDDDDAAINLTVTEVKEDPKLTSISKNVNGTVATFTVKGNADAKYGIVLYADGYKLDMINWSKSGTSTITYTGSHTFNQTGTRNIVVYALDKDGNEVRTSGTSVSATITINSLGVISAPTITTANNQKIEVGNSFKIAWTKPTAPTGVTFKYNVYVWDGVNNTLVAEHLTATSCTIPANKLSKVGTYAISVIAMATDYTQSNDDDATINLTITEVKEDPKLTSISKSVNGTVATFTVKGNADAKYGIVLYADGYKLDMINWSKSGTSTVTYTGSHTFNQTGTRNIVVYALDKNGNEVRTSGASVTTTIIINSLGVIAAPSITTTNNQKVEVGNSFKITWSKPTTPTGVTFKYNVYVWDGVNNTLVAENLTTTSYTVPANKLSKVGTYAISVIAMATDYTQSDDDDATINLIVTEVKEDPKLTSINKNVNGTVATFTVKGNADAKYGIVLYADGYKLDMINWSKSGTSTVTYTGSHTFNQTGTRNIVVYALDKDGNEVRTSGTSVSTTITITSLGVISAPSVTTANNQKIEVGNSFKISWTKPTTPTGVTFKYNVYVWDGKTNVCVNSSAITGTSYTIPASYFAKAGTYTISVIAMATDYTQSNDDDAAINLTVTEVQENPDLTSVSGTVNGTVATFTVKGNADAKYGIVLYADGYKLDMINWSKSGTSTVTYTGSHTFNQTGTRNIVVYALDKNGNEVSGSKVTTTVNITSLGVISAPSITTANNQKIEVDNSFKISWTKPTTPTGVTFKYNVYVWDGTTNALVGENLTTTSYTIPADKLSKVGTYAISVIAMATDYTQSDDDDASINLIVTEVQENPDLTSVSASVSGTVVTFTVKGNVAAKYGIVLYADGYKLDMIDWIKSDTSTVTYTGSHTFNQTGERKITVYALDENGNEISDSKVTTTVKIDSLGKCGTPSITTSNNKKIEVGNSFTISWNKPTTPSGAIFKYNIYVWDGKTNTLVGENLSTTSCTIAANELSKVGTYTISVIAMASDYTQSDEASINLNVIEKETVAKITLTTPRVSGSSKIQYGDDYTISWDFDAQVDYYQITIDGLNYKKTINATEKSFTIPGSVFKQYSGADTNYTISLVAMSHDTEKYLPSEAATIRVNVAGYSESNALIKSAEILDGNEIIAGTVVRFKVVTTKDVTALRMKDGAGSFIVNTWYASEIGTNSSNAQYYKDSGNERTWYVQQKVNHAGDANAAGAKRLLTFYSMVNEVEYNNCSVSFYCKKGNDVIGKFEITSPGNNAMLPSGKDIAITWSAPTNTTVDYYIVDVYHGDVRVDRATVTSTTYTLLGTLLEKDSIAWQIRVTARKDEGQWAESVATASFKLECTHEHLGQPTENILSYAQKNDTVHSCVVEKTYACLDCGLANAKKVQETVTKSHNWLALDKGGKVCNQCWHLQSDGSFTVKKDMQLSSLAGNRELVYFNVDASGNPANKQNGRYVDKTDKITILGEVGNCYLIEYPITVNTRASGATNCGFIDSDLVGEPEEHNREPVRSNEQQIVDEFIEKYFDPNYYWTAQPYLDEYICAGDIASSEALSNKAIAAVVISDGLTENIRLIFNGPIKTLFGSDQDYYQRMVKTFVNNVVIEIPTDTIDFMKELEGAGTVAEEAQKINNLIGKFADKAEDTGLLDAANERLDDYFSHKKPELWKKIGKGTDLENITNVSGEATDLFFSAFEDYIIYVKIQTAGSLEYYDLLIEMFAGDPETISTIEAARDRYMTDSFAFVEFALSYIENNLIDKAIDLGTDAILLGIAKISGKVLNVGAVDFARTIISELIGLTDYAQGSTTLICFNYINEAIKFALFENINEYLNGEDTIEKAQRIISLYNLSRGCQIYINKSAINVTNDINKQELMENEIAHLKKIDIENWKVNPYYVSTTVKKPNLSLFDNVPNSYYYKILLDGYVNRDDDGLLAGWEDMSAYEKQMVANEVDSLYNFALYDVDKMLLLEIAGNGYGFVFVNTNGEGLLIRYFSSFKGESAQPYSDIEVYTAFTTLTQKQVENIVNGKAEMPDEYFFVKRHKRSEVGILAGGYRSVAIENNSMYYSYISFDINKQQYQTLLYHILSYKTYASTRQHIHSVVKPALMAVWDVDISWALSNNSIAQIINRRADKKGADSLRVSVVESDWRKVRLIG